MKKLMTMLAAAAMAFGLYADVNVGADFESTDPTTITPTWQTTGAVEGYWTGLTAENAKVVDGGCTTVGITRPEQFALSTHEKSLSIKTTLGNPIEQKIKTSGSEIIPDDGLYFDGLVNLTMFDEEPVLDSYTDAKIAVYAQEIEEEEVVTGTNFVVVAKAVDSDATFRFVCGGGLPEDLAGWHRLTIKAIGDIGTGATGFVVFIDGTAVNCEDAKIAPAGLTLAAQDWNANGQLFVSLVDDDATIKSVAFDGQGSVDELVFTTTAPDFAKDLNIATVAFDGTKVENVQYKIGDDGEWTEAVGNPFKIAAERGATLPESILVKWTGIGNVMDNTTGVTVTLTADQESEIPGTAYKTAAAMIGTAKYELLASAVAAAKDGDKLVLLQDAAADVLDFSLDEGAASIELDLNGKSVAASEVGGTSIKAGKGIALTIVDGSEADGKVEGVAKKQGSGSSLTIYAGAFKEEPNATIPDNKVWGDGTDDYAGYRVLVDAVTATFVSDNVTVDTQKIAKGTAPTNVVVTKEGYTFKGWDPAISAIDEDKTFTAQWEQDVTPVTVTVSFDPTSAEWSDTGSFPAPTITFNPTGSYTEDTDYTVAWTDAAGDPATYPEVNPVADTNFTVTVTMKGNYSGSGTATFTVTKKAEEEPVEPGQEIKTDKTPEQINANTPEGKALKKKLLTAPEGATVGDDYYGLFDAVAGDTDGTVKFVLNSDGTNAVVAAEKAADTAVLAAALDASATTATVPNPLAGFYYSLKQNKELEKLGYKSESDMNKLGGSEAGVSFELDKDPASGFYQIIVTPVQEKVTIEKGSDMPVVPGGLTV